MAVPVLRHTLFRLNRNFVQFLRPGTVCDRERESGSPNDRPAFGPFRDGYRAPQPVRLSRLVAARLALGAGLLGTSAGGCSFSYQLGSLLGNDANRPGQTMLAAAASQPAVPAAGKLGEGDLVHARAAVVRALAKGGTSGSTPWENRATGARGTVTPITSAKSENGSFVCRDFLASYVRDGSETWLKGEACRVRSGRWEVRRLAPWKRT